jgi:ATP-dependent DNA helicase RecG
MNALISLNLVNRNNLGVQRMYQAMLQDGKEPPIIRDEGNAVRVTFLGSEYSVPFRAFVESMMRSGLRLSLEHLLVLNYLVRHGEIDAPTAAHICQQHEREIRESLHSLVVREVLDVRRRGGATIWQLSPATIRALRDDHSKPSPAPPSKFEAAQSQVLAWLREAQGSGELGLQSEELRERLGFTSEEIKYVTKKLKQRNLIESTGRGPKAMWVLVRDK